MERLNLPNWVKITAAATAMLALSGCGKGDYEPTESFANCDVSEFRDRQPIKLHHPPVDRHDVEALRRAVEKSPDILLETARLSDLPYLDYARDSAHDDGNLHILYDFIDSPGDILCQVTPVGASGDSEREVYYDQDGLDLLKVVQQRLATEYPEPEIG